MTANLEYARMVAAERSSSAVALGEPVSRRRHRPGTRRVLRPNIVRLLPGITRLPIVPGGAPA